MKIRMRKNLISLLLLWMVLLFLIPCLGSTYHASEIRMIPQSSSLHDFFGNITNLSILHIGDGLGLTIVVKNNGQNRLENISVSINRTSSCLVRLKTTHHLISSLAVNESTKIHIKLFGLSLGTFLPQTEITIVLTTSEDIQKEVRIVTRVFGPFTHIITTYFTGEAFHGYTLFSPEYSKKTFLIDKEGNMVHTWESQFLQGLGLSLLENGNLLRTILPYNNPVFTAGGMTGGIELFDWNGTKRWQYNYSNSQHCLHHGITPLPNGNVLLVAWEYKTAEEAIAAGRNPDSLPTGEIWPDHIIEVELKPPFGGSIVWEWHVWDHLIQDFDPLKENYGVIEDHPELIDINYDTEIGKQRADWNHINSIDYNEEFDQILVSVKNFHELWVIDHSTTREEAAGHTGGNSGKGGDLLYRWGNPAAYRRGLPTERKLFAQHDASWISSGCPGEGNILVFNNGQGRPDGYYSSVDELIPPVDATGLYYLSPGSAYGPEEPVWSYSAPDPFTFFAGYLSSAQRLPNGNTLICNGDHGLFFEVTTEQKTVWKYHNMLPNPFANQVFKILCYAPDYPGLKDLQ
ncbi:MAG: aryl-sulfate sulfotransferase [Candidatus Thermoplasmatota archaeon]|nr:aryl-sulfate sulfotransferase [Candidatus Thermoplasmatota archaeon]